MKKLICAEDIENAKDRGEKIFYIDCNTIITPLAIDAAKNYEIEFSNEIETCEVDYASKDKMDMDMIYKVFKAMMDRGILKDMMDLICEKPYIAETDCGGLKVIRGNSVKFKELDTKNPNTKVFYRELIGEGDCPINAGFLTIDDSSFDWELEYEEIDYIIEGTLKVIINGREFIAYSGDVIYIPSGSKISLSSPDKAKLFYTTYQLNK